MWGWAVVGMLVETYGFWLLFAGFFPTVLSFLRRIPVLGRALDLPMLKSVRPAFERVQVSRAFAAVLARSCRTCAMGRAHWSPLSSQAHCWCGMQRAHVLLPTVLSPHATVNGHAPCPAGAEQDSAGAVAACVGAQACSAGGTLPARSAGIPQLRAFRRELD